MTMITNEYMKEAEEHFPQGCLTMSKHHKQFAYNVPDAILSVDPMNGKLLSPCGEEYIDWSAGLGACNSINTDICSIPLTVEIEAARLVKQRVPCIQKLRFLKTGSEACAAALRYARAFTGRKSVFGTGYHGYLNEFISAESPGAGTVRCRYTKFTDVGHMLWHLEAIATGHYPAAVIIEPVILDDTTQRMAEVKALRLFCKLNDILFIADEVVSGFRFPGGTVSKAWSLSPDIIILGKGISGNALSVVGGRADVLDSPGVFISTTFAGERRPLEHLIHKLSDPMFEDKINEQWRLGAWLKSDFNRIAPDLVKLKGYNTRMTWEGDMNNIVTYWEGMAERGHIMGRAFFVGQQHSKFMIREFLQDSLKVLREMKSGERTLKGYVPVPPFERFGANGKRKH